jgi:hypothetical protein
MGGNGNMDIDVEKAAGWEACCELCIKYRGMVGTGGAVDGDVDSGGRVRDGDATNNKCVGWTYFSDYSTCHLHANTKDQHPGLVDRITGVLPSAQHVIQ